MFVRIISYTSLKFIRAQKDHRTYIGSEEDLKRKIRAGNLIQYRVFAYNLGLCSLIPSTAKRKDLSPYFAK
jgi:hypothetical protein